MGDQTEMSPNATWGFLGSRWWAPHFRKIQVGPQESQGKRKKHHQVLNLGRPSSLTRCRRGERPLPNLYLTGHRPSGGKQLPSGGMGASAWRFWTQMFRGPGFLLVLFYYLFLWVKWRFWRLHPNVCSTPPPFFWNCVHKPFFQLKIMLPTICRLWHPSCPIFHMAILPGCSRIKTLKSDWNQILSWNFWKIACIVRQL